MTRVRRRPRWPVAAIILSFIAGVLVGMWLHAYGPPIPRAAALDATATPKAPEPKLAAPDRSARRPAATPEPTRTTVTTGSLPSSRLRVPIDGADIEAWKNGFDERRDGGQRGHEAIDILSPRNTPVHAVAAGTIAKIFESKAGGHTVYQLDAGGRLCYYYAHLERYADGLHEGQAVAQGDVVGFVGTSGNAPPTTPHLHFAVFELNDQKRWWKGVAIDPYPLFRNGS